LFDEKGVIGKFFLGFLCDGKIEIEHNHNQRLVLSCVSCLEIAVDFGLVVQ